MKHDDTTLQAAIDAAMIELGGKVKGNSFAACRLLYPIYWGEESTARLALAKAFLAKLPEAQPILADDGRSLGQVAYEAKAYHQFEATALRAPTWENAERYVKDSHKVMAQVVANVVLAQAIRRMEAVTTHELARIFDGYVDTVRDRLIAAARGEEGQQPDSTDWKAKYEQAEAERKKWEEDALRYCKNAEFWQTERDKALAEIGEYKVRVDQLHDTISNIKAKLAALKSSPIGILRPLTEAGPVPDGCVRMLGSNKTDGKWSLATWEDEYDTHFADIRLPSNETSAIEAADPYARLKAYAKAGARIRLNSEYVRSDWTLDKEFPFWLSPEKYEVHPDDLHLVPEYAPVNEQPKQQVPLGPEDVMPGSVFRLVGADDESAWQQPHEILCSGAAFHNGGGTVMWKDWSYLASRFEINRSIPLTGKWDANAWEPCYKMI